MNFRDLAFLCIFACSYLTSSVKADDSDHTQFLFSNDNVTLDTSLDHIPPPPGVTWIMAGYYSRYFEYHHNTSHFRDETHNPNSCAHYMSDEGLQGISEVNGIWVACQDTMVDEDCTSSPYKPCSPFIYSYSTPIKPRTLKISLVLENSAILRLHVPEPEACIDYGWRKDPYSVCEFRSLAEEIEPDSGWNRILFSFTPNKESNYKFKLEMIARFQRDVILIDKIELTEYHLCDWHAICPGTLFPPTTTSSPSSENGTLDTKGDTVGSSNPWKLAQEYKRYMEYHDDTLEFRNNSENPGSCAYDIPEGVLTRLQDVDGIWAVCHDPTLPPDCTAVPSSPCNAFIDYNKKSVTGIHKTVKITYALVGLAILRLSVKHDCIDFSRRRDPFSTCLFKEVPDSDGWSQIIFNFYPEQNELFSQFRLDLITRFQHDVILIDKVEATPYLLCDTDVICPTPPTTTFPTWPTPTTSTFISMSTASDTTENEYLTSPIPTTSSPTPPTTSSSTSTDSIHTSYPTTLPPDSTSDEAVTSNSTTTEPNLPSSRSTATESLASSTATAELSSSSTEEFPPVTSDITITTDRRLPTTTPQPTPSSTSTENTSPSTASSTISFENTFHRHLIQLFFVSFVARYCVI